MTKQHMRCLLQKQMQLKHKEVIRIHPLGNMSVCITFYGNPSNNTKVDQPTDKPILTLFESKNRKFQPYILAKHYII